MSSIASLTAAILVGGLGTRLQAVVTDRPKPLAEVHGRPFLTYLLDQVAAAGFQHVVLCTGYRAEQVPMMLGNQYRSLTLSYSRENQALGTGGAMRLALPLLNSATLLVMSGNSMCECDLEAFWQWHLAHRSESSLMMTLVSDVSRYGQIEVDEGGAITRFVEKDSSQSGAGWINAGIYLLARSIIAKIPEGKAVSLEREVFVSRIGRGLFGHQGGGRFIDIGTPESYQLASQFFAPGTVQ